jgi:hypothetical protein
LTRPNKTPRGESLAPRGVEANSDDLASQMGAFDSDQGFGPSLLDIGSDCRWIEMYFFFVRFLIVKLRREPPCNNFQELISAMPASSCPEYIKIDVIVCVELEVISVVRSVRAVPVVDVIDSSLRFGTPGSTGGSREP